MLNNPLVGHYGELIDAYRDATRSWEPARHEGPASPTRDPLRALTWLLADHQERRQLARASYRHILRGTFFETGTTDLTYAMRRAGEEPTLYEDSTGEAHPPHAAHALALEIELWQHLTQTHERGAHNTVAACQHLRPVARALERVLDLEDDLLTSPLTTSYIRTVDALRSTLPGS